MGLPSRWAVLCCVMQLAAMATAMGNNSEVLILDATAAPFVGAPDPNAPLSWKGIVTGICCVVLLLILSFDLVSCHVAMFALTLFLQLCGIINTSDALSGLMNSSVIAVQLLVVLTGPVAKLPMVKLLIQRLLNSTSIDDSSRRRWVLAVMNFKICLIAYSLSWFVGNIPTTVILTPLIHHYCLEHAIPSSQLLMSIQIAGLVGGTFSKIGVSTTMLVSGLMEQHGLAPLPFFETIKVSGIPAIFALLYMTVAPHYLLPRETKGIVQQMTTQAAKNFLGDFIILPTSYVVGRAVAALRGELVDHHVDVISVAIADGFTVLTPPPEDLVLAAGQRLTLTGDPKSLQVVAQWLHLEWQSQEAPDELSTFGQTFDDTFRGSVASPHIAARLSTRLSYTQNRSFLAGTHKGRAVSRAVIDDDVSPTDDSPSVLAEVVLSDRAAVVGRSVGRLRTLYHIALLGLRRGGENYSPSQVMSKLNTYHSGDTLLIVGPMSLIQTYDKRGDFLLVTMLDDAPSALSKDDGTSYVVVPMKFPFGRLMLEDGFGRILSSAASDSTHAHSADAKRNFEGSPLLATSVDDVKSPTATGAPAAAPPVPPAVAMRRYRKVIVVPRWYSYVTLLVLAAAIGASIGGQELVVCCQVGVVAVLALRLRRLEDAVKSLKFEVFVVMAFSFGLGAAMTKSGLSLYIAGKIASANISGWTLQFVISLTASMMSNIISSKAAAQVLLPVVLDIAAARGEDPLASLVVLSVSIVQSLITPYSHASGLVVQGPGGYTAVDFYKIGTPLNFILCVLVATTAVAFY
jgi:di/tricarboxylate transporter